MTTQAPLVVIVGGGFGGLAAAKGSKRFGVNALLIDRSNHHVFQPLLYQVATSVLASGQIASPIRSLLAEQTNASVMLGNVTGIDAASKQVTVEAADKVGLKIRYDYLIIATGANHSYFGHDEFAAFAPGLKSLADAEGLRNRILEVFEKAEIEDDPERRRALMTFVMVGLGPQVSRLQVQLPSWRELRYDETSGALIRRPLTSSLLMWERDHLPLFQKGSPKQRCGG